jgi:hypothetical protein
MKRKPRRRKTPEWMTMSAYGIMQMLPGNARQAREVLKIALKLVDAAARIQAQSTA